MKKFCTLFAVTLLLLWASFAFGQTVGGTGDTGIFGAADVHEVDTIDLFSLNVELNIPLVVNRTGAIPFAPMAVMENHCQKNQVQNGTFRWDCVGPWIGAGAHVPSFGYTNTQTTDSCSAGALTYSNWAVTETIDSSNDTTNHPVTGTVSTCAGVASSLTSTTTDNSGYTLAVNWTGSALSIVVTNRSGYSLGNTTVNGITIPASAFAVDTFGNYMTSSYNGMTSTTTYTDTLGSTFTDDLVSATTRDLGYTDTTGTAQTIAETAAGTATTLTGSTQCSTTSDQANLAVKPYSFSYPDGTSISTTVETDQGRVGSITLRTGGTISYAYGSPLTCPTGRPSFPSSLTRTTADGTTTYTLTTQTNGYIDTVVDPGKNKVVYSFSGSSYPLLTEVQRYQNTGTVASPSYTLISQSIYCYNNTTPASSCPNAAYSTTTITQKDIYEYVGTGNTFMSQRTLTYDSYGDVLTDVLADQISGQTITKTIVYGTWNGTSCAALGTTTIQDHPCTITTKKGTTQLAYETVTYNTNGAPTASTEWISSTDTLTTNYTANSNGTMATKTLPNSQVVTYTYGNCNSLLPTDITTTVNSVALDNKMTWNCNGAVVVDTTDENSNEDDTTYDSMFRVATHNDYLDNATSYAYGTPTLDHVKVTDPLSVVSYQYVDGLGRPTNSQVCQTTGCSNLDTSSTAYAWNGTNFETTTYVPCVKTTLNSACTTVALTADSNPVFGPVKTTDANSGTLTWARNSKDFSITAGPAPSQENTKVLQTEVDGFGRVTSACALTASGYDGRVSCGQTMGNSGTLTSNVYSFDATTGAPKVVATRGSQSHTTITDSIGRPTTKTTPEAGTSTGVYDSIAANYCVTGGAASSSSGALVATTDAASNKICMYRDGLYRLTDTGNSNQSSTNYCTRLRYDSTANKFVTAPTGYSGNNIVGRMFEAETDNCAATPTTLTDVWVSYDKDGRITDYFESTPNSGGYYHTTVAYDADGAVTSLSGIPSTSTFTFGVDGEDRPFNLEYGTTWIVGSSTTTGVSYDAASRPTTVPLSTSGDQDAFTWDNVGNMTDFKFTVNSTNFEGALTWNSIGSLNKQVITDGFNSGGSQTCKYGSSTVEGYDDVGRLLDADCGSLIQHDSWTYDQYDNATRSGNPGTSWNPGYSATTNEMTGSTYDNDGNVKYDGVNSFSWNIFGQMAGTVSGNHTISCGSSGHYCLTYDAFGRVVEINSAGTYSQMLYSPIGRVASMNGQTCCNWIYVPTPGGGTFSVIGGTKYFSHPDWLGTKRLGTSIVGRSYLFDVAYTPYGELYDTFSTGSSVNDFTGLTDDITQGMYATPTRQLLTNEGRWPSPDPSHSGWNAYAYVTDPNTQTDRSGLNPQDPGGNAPQGQGGPPPKPAASCALFSFCWFKAHFGGTPDPDLSIGWRWFGPRGTSVRYVSGDVSLAGGPPPRGLDFAKQFAFGSDRLKLQNALGLSKMEQEVDHKLDVMVAMVLGVRNARGAQILFDEWYEAGGHPSIGTAFNDKAFQVRPILGLLSHLARNGEYEEALVNVANYMKYGKTNIAGQAVRLDLHNAIIEAGGGLVDYMNSLGSGEYHISVDPISRAYYNNYSFYVYGRELFEPYAYSPWLH